MDDAVDTGADGGFEDAGGAEDVGFIQAALVTETEAVEAGRVKHNIRAGKGLGQAVGIAQVQGLDLDGIRKEPMGRLGSAGESTDMGAAAEQFPDQPASDEAIGPGYNNLRSYHLRHSIITLEIGMFFFPVDGFGRTGCRARSWRGGGAGPAAGGFFLR
jgi:hypothetical protein